MKLLIVRHAIAMDKEQFAWLSKKDEPRPLTKEGRTRFVKAVRGLRRVQPKINTIISSRLTRAKQTADLIKKEYKHPRMATNDYLSPGQPPAALLASLKEYDKKSVVCVVGHEPSLSEFASWLLTGKNKSLLELKKGGACLLELPRPLAPGRAELLWSLKPSHLRQLA